MTFMPRMSTILPFVAAIAFVSRPAAAQRSDSSSESEIRANERQRREKDAEDARSRRITQDFAGYIDTTSELLNRLHQKTTSFASRMKEALTNDDGKRLALDPTAFMTFLRIQEEPAMTIDQVTTRRKSLDSLKEGIAQELKSPNVGYVPNESQRNEVSAIYFWAHDRFSRLAEQSSWLDAALEKAPKGVDLSTAKTLDAVIRDYSARRLEFWGQAKALGEAQAKEPSQKVLVDSSRLAELERAQAQADVLLSKARAEIEMMKLEHELMIKQLRAEGKSRQADADNEIQDMLAKVERDQKIAEARRAKQNIEADIDAKKTTDEGEKLRLRNKCKDPEVTSILAPFLEKGYWQPAGGSGIDKIPVSFSKLRAAGALSPTPSGLQKLLACGVRPIGTNKNPDQIRPRWPYDPRLSKAKPEEIEELKKAQGYLNELGETMVELKLLSP